MFIRTSSFLLGTGLACLLATACGNSNTDGGGGAGLASPSTPTEARSNLPRDTAPSVVDADFQAVLDGNTAFAFDLYGKLSESSANFFCSPLSVSTALAMTWAGARGLTESQMATTLHFPLAQNKMHPAFNKLMLELDSRNVALHQTEEGNKTLKLQLTNAAWAQKNYTFLPEYLDTLAVHHDAGINLLDFQKDPPGTTKIINDWVAKQTEDKIQNLIPDGAITEYTRLVLTNTLYFYGNWATVFDKNQTKDGTFHAPSADVTVPVMHGVAWTGYTEGDGYQMANLPYDGGKLAMTIVLPAAGRFDEIRGNMTAAWLSAAVGKMADHGVSFALPKFRFVWGTESLKKPLETLGMTDAFDTLKADFTGMEPTGELYIGDVLHKAFVGVDESGTEAAAATAVLVLGGGLPDRTIEIDRPFVFFVRDTVTGTLLFVGHVVDPTL